MAPETKEIIALDLGMARTGIARASTIARLPEPLFSVATNKTLDTVKQLVKDKQVEAVVVGLPRNLSGQDTEQTKWVRNWVKSAKNDLDTSFFWQDEALTSHVASERSHDKIKDVDAEAAAIILQDFLDTPADKRVIC